MNDQIITRCVEVFFFLEFGVSFKTFLSNRVFKQLLLWVWIIKTLLLVLHSLKGDKLC